MSKQVLVLGTRGSKLALTQSEQIAALLRAIHSDLDVELRIITTKGDQILDVALSAVGDKGLFVKEIETALLAGEIDLAVHSCKDMPSQLPEGLLLAAFPQRVDPRDVLVFPTQSPETMAVVEANPLDRLPLHATVGTSSLRRACQLRAMRPDLRILDVRGNVDTRLRKLDEGQYDAIILAAAGLRRLGLGARTHSPLPPEVMLPAVAQGTLAIEARADDAATLALLGVLDDHATRVATLAERAFLRRLEGGCQVPIAAYAQLEEQSHAGQTTSVCQLHGLVGSLDGQQIVRGMRVGPASTPEQVGTALAEELLERGAADILTDLRTVALHADTGES